MLFVNRASHRNRPAKSEEGAAMERVIVVTPEELRQIIREEVAQAVTGAEQSLMGGGLVHGLAGIMKLFGVKKSEAMKYKRTFLGPAVMQIGRRFTVDVKLAWQLYREEAARQRAIIDNIGKRR